ELVQPLVEMSAGDARADAGRRGRAVARRRRVGVMRLHVVQVREEATASIRAQPAEERLVDLAGRRPVLLAGAAIAPDLELQLLERLEPLRVVGRPRDERVGRDADGRD